MPKHPPRSATPFSARRLDAYKVALELLSYMQPHLQRIASQNRELKKQLDRSLPSIVNNLSEALRRTGADRPYHLTVSLGSADEARASIDSALAYGLMDPHEAAHADNLADRYCAMVYRLRQRFQ